MEDTAMPEDIVDAAAVEKSDRTTELLQEITQTMAGGNAEQDGEDSASTPPSYPYSRAAIAAIRAARQDQGLSARQLSDLCSARGDELGVTHTLSRGRLAKLENGLNGGSLSVDELVLASLALGVSVAHLLGDTILQPDEQRAIEQLRELHARLGSALGRLPQSWDAQGEA